LSLFISRLATAAAIQHWHMAAWLVMEELHPSGRHWCVAKYACVRVFASEPLAFDSTSKTRSLRYGVTVEGPQVPQPDILVL